MVTSSNPEPDERREHRQLQAGLLLAIAVFLGLSWLLFGR
jgi:hypothetical protein